MFFLESPFTNAYFNLALEEYLFSHLPDGKCCFFLWQNENAIVVGRHQDTQAEIHADAVRHYGVTVVRRLSGGGAMYQDMGNLNYTYIVPMEHMDKAAFTQPILAALDTHHVQAQASGRNDLCIQGRKFSGNAQYNRNNKLLHHGTLLWNTDLHKMQRLLSPPPEKLQRHAVASVRSRVTNLTEHLPASLTLAAWKQTLLHCVFGNQECIAYPIPDSALREILANCRNKYATHAWNYGSAADAGI